MIHCSMKSLMELSYCLIITLRIGLRHLKKNLIEYFISEPKEGIDMVLKQRPAGDFSDLDDDQFRNYVEQIFIKFIGS